MLALLIDGPYYAAQAEREFGSMDELVDHFMAVGGPNGLDPSPIFDSARYRAASPQGRIRETPAFLHYLFEVVDEGALAHALAGLSIEMMSAFYTHFDAEWYARNNPDVDMAVNHPLVHYLTSGWREARDPSPVFSTGAYLEIHADVRESGMHPFRHWVLHGFAEGRSSAHRPVVAADAWENLTSSRQSILLRIFDIDYYRLPVTGACDSGMSVARDIVSRGADGAFTPSFHVGRYVAAHPGLSDTAHRPFLHYLFETVGEDALRDLFSPYPSATVDAVCTHFDTAWYLYNYPDIEASGQDAFIHYMTVGWRENRDPSREFSTRAYLLRYPDIVEAGVNPLLHWVMFGQTEGRSGASSATKFRNRVYAPSITAILTNDRADPLTPECITAVLHQSYSDLDILIVGTPLSVACLDALNTDALGPRAIPFTHVPGDDAVSPWALMRAAVEHARGDLVWFVQRHGIHNFEFLARLTSSFADGSVQLGFGRQLNPDDADYAIDENALARQMEGWTRHATTPAAQWFPSQLRPDVLTADQQSFLWRRRTMNPDVWHGADDYAVLAVWHILLHMASGGQIATVRDALVRAVPSRTATLVSVSDDYFVEDIRRFSAELQSFWSLPEGMAGDGAQTGRTKRHILIVTHGIFAGGAENLPIQLANELAARGLIVSMLLFKTDLNPEMRATLNPGVSIYEADWVLEYGCEQFIRDIGCSLIHSHGVVGEMFFFRLCPGPLPVPYVATLHGSYEASTSTELPESFLAKIVRNVDLFVYTADKNLVPLIRHGVRSERIVKMINAMPIDEVAFPYSRADLGIADDALVYTLVARGIAEKGWNTAVNAFRSVQRRNPHRSMHLCLVGEGEEPERLKMVHAGDGSISFLGFQLRIHGLYRMTDVAIVPTRFAGESFPLCIIQALQVAVPVIATDVGEIASMLRVGETTGGIVVEWHDADAQFDAHFADAMQTMVDDEQRHRLRAGADILGRGYDMAAFTEQYIALYEDVMDRFTAALPIPAGQVGARDAVDAEA